MDPVNNCGNCSWSEQPYKNVCSYCDFHSKPENPFPYWTPMKQVTEDFNPREDVVNHPKHYTNHPSGIECIQITEHMNFCLGNAIKYIWRAGLKSDNKIQDLEKAIWYVQREIAKEKA